MEQKQSPKTKWLTIRMSEDEYKEAERLAARTTCHSLSEYGRRTVLGKPVVRLYRNASLDDFMPKMLELQNELNSIGASFNQLVRRLQTLRQVPDIQHWILQNEKDKTRLFQTIEAISDLIIKSYQLWSQK